MTSVTLTYDMVLVLSIVAFTVILSISNVIRVDVVAVLVLVVLGITKLLPPEQLFSGFSSEAVIALIAVMIMSGGLEKSGVTTRAARFVLNLSREHPDKTNVLVMAMAGILSGFMRNLGTVALMLPVVSRITQRTGIPKSRMLMPMAFCSIMGATLTMVGTGPLILLNSLLTNAHIYGASTNLPHFHLFSVFPIGLVMLISGILYFIFFGRKLLPKTKNESIQSGRPKAYFLKTYGKGGDILELRMLPNSPLINLPLRDFELKLDPSCSVLALRDDKEIHFPPLKKDPIKPNSILAVMGIKEKILEFAEEYGLRVQPKLNIFAEMLHPMRAGMAEAVIPPSSQLIGQEIRELHMRRNFNLHVLAILRGQTVYKGEQMKDLVARSGDTLCMFCEWQALNDFKENPDFAVLTTSFPREEIRASKAKYALFFFILSLVLIVFGTFSVSVGLLLGAVGMIATGVLDIDEAYKTVSWQSVFLMAGLIPLGLALQTTHTTDWIAQHSFLLHSNFPLFLIEIFLACLATFFSFIMSGAGATIVLVPIALELANALNANPTIFILIVAISASNSFLMPTQQGNALIQGPGQYTTRDFFKVGSGMTVLHWTVMLLTVNLFFG